MSDIKFHQTPRPAARYVSATTVREEALENTRLIGVYWSASGQVQRENITATLPGLDPLIYPLQVFDLEIDGQKLHNNWAWITAGERLSKRPGTREAFIELRHQVRPVTVKIVTRLDDTPFLVRYLEITNTGNAPAALSRVSPWSGILWTSREPMNFLPDNQPSPFTLGYFDSPAPGIEGNFIWEPLPRGTRRIESTSGQSGFGNPCFIIRNEVTGECAMGALAWSGNWYAEFWRDPCLNHENYPDRGLNLAFRMGPSGSAPLRVMAPRETITTPETHLALLHADLDACVAAFHTHLRASVIPPRPKGKELFPTAGRVVEEPGEWILREIDIAAEMGLDAFMVDANWYGDTFGNWWDQRGDWTVGDWIPGGLAACRERAHRHGMLFGLWMEPESVGPRSRLLQEHPDWLLRTDGDRMAAQVLNLAHPEAARFFTESVLRVIREHQVDFFKIDYNIRIHEGGQHLRDGFLENESWRHYEVLYSLFERVRAEFPEVALETCAAGGGRLDLGMFARFHYGCESDYSTFPRSIRAINGLTLFIPPESLCYYHNHLHYAHQTADLDTHLRVALFAQPIFVGFGAQDADRNTEYHNITRRYIRLIREFTRPLLANHPRVFHHTPDIGVQGPADWCVLEYAARDRRSAYAGIFRVGSTQHSGSQEYLYRPRGLHPEIIYQVTLDNTGATIEKNGADLIHFGLPVRIGAPGLSELLLFKAVA